MALDPFDQMRLDAAKSQIQNGQGNEALPKLYQLAAADPTNVEIQDLLKQALNVQARPQAKTSTKSFWHKPYVQWLLLAGILIVFAAVSGIILYAVNNQTIGEVFVPDRDKSAYTPYITTNDVLGSSKGSLVAFPLNIDMKTVNNADPYAPQIVVKFSKGTLIVSFEVSLIKPKAGLHTLYCKVMDKAFFGNDTTVRVEKIE